MLTALLLTLLSPAQATEIGSERMIGLGLSLGYPQTINAKFYLGDRLHAIEAGVGSFQVWSAYTSVYAHAVYLAHPSVLASDPSFELPWHVGVGPFLGAAGYVGNGALVLGARPQIGLDMDFVDVPLQLSLDAYALVYLTLDISAGGALAIRYFF